MIATCLQAHSTIANLTFRVEDASAFRLEERFDAAVSFSALHWVSDLNASLVCIRNALETGSRLVIGMGGGHQREIADVFRSERWRPRLAGKGRTFYGKTREELRDALLGSGFQNVEVEAIESARPYPSEDALLDWILAWLPHATGLQGQRSEEGLALRSTMLAATAVRA
jgi:trans-aconitate methyltransferase